MTALEAQEAIIADFAQYDEWEDKYRHIIEMGRALPPLAEELRTAENIVRGCQSQVWLHGEYDASAGVVRFVGDSDAAIVKGLVALALRVYSGQSPQEIVSVAPDFMAKIGLTTHLSPNRTNGFASMIKKIKIYGVAFSLRASQG
jgi:cysteine desulfuration protein SufE